MPFQKHKNLEVRLASTPADVDAAQALRYRVFYEELGAHPTTEMRARQRDFDSFDEICDHLIVSDHSDGRARPRVVGTYRLMRRAIASNGHGFYSQSEFDLTKLLQFPGEVLELGRSCVDPAYRDGAVMPLLWRGLADYILKHGVQLMFGCASLPGTDPGRLAMELAYLHHFHLAPQQLRAKAVDHRYVDMGILPRTWLSEKAVLGILPPLIKGYLRVGGMVGEGAVVDHQFRTTDICVIAKTDKIADKYQRHFLKTARSERMVA